MSLHRFGITPLVLAPIAALSADDRLTTRPPPAAAKIETLAVSPEVRAVAGQRRRLQLPGGAILFVNQNTIVTLTDANRLTLARGEVYLEPTGTRACRRPAASCRPRGAGSLFRRASAARVCWWHAAV
jgi:hypothetical protein